MQSSVRWIRPLDVIGLLLGVMLGVGAVTFAEHRERQAARERWNRFEDRRWEKEAKRRVIVKDLVDRGLLRADPRDSAPWHPHPANPFIPHDWIRDTDEAVWRQP